MDKEKVAIDKGSLNSLAQDARNKLQSQLDSGEDIYAKMREDNEKDIEEESTKINVTSNKEEETERVKIQNVPDEEYFEENKTEPVNSYDEPLFEGGPTVTQVESFKKTWAGYDVYATEIIGQYFLFRTLNRFEYKQIVALKNTDPIQREEIICEAVTLWPDNYDYRTMAVSKAGIPSTYSQIIMEKSGFTKEYTIQVI